MIQKLFTLLIGRQIECQIIKAEDEDVYKYGYTLLFETILNLIFAVTIGIIFSKLRAVLFFLFFYIPLRSFCGGWHANKIWKCTIISNAILLLQIYGIKRMAVQTPMYGIFIFFLFNAACVLALAPIGTKTKSITEKERYTYKRKIYYIFGIHFLFMVCSSMAYLYEIAFSLMYVYLVQNIMLILEMLNQKFSDKTLKSSETENC